MKIKRQNYFSYSFSVEEISILEKASKVLDKWECELARILERSEDYHRENFDNADYPSGLIDRILNEQNEDINADDYD